jgi:hypothetical protein
VVEAAALRSAGAPLPLVSWRDRSAPSASALSRVGEAASRHGLADSSTCSLAGPTEAALCVLAATRRTSHPGAGGAPSARARANTLEHALLSPFSSQPLVQRHALLACSCATTGSGTRIEAAERRLLPSLVTPEGRGPRCGARVGRADPLNPFPAAGDGRTPPTRLSLKHRPPRPLARFLA